jgi:hypothetical protein
MPLYRLIISPHHYEINGVEELDAFGKTEKGKDYSHLKEDVIYKDGSLIVNVESLSAARIKGYEIIENYYNTKELIVKLNAIGLIGV